MSNYPEKARALISTNRRLRLLSVWNRARMINMSIEGWLSKGGYANHGSRSCHEHPWLEFASDRPRNIHRIAKGAVLSSTVEGKFRDESRFRPVPRIISPLNIESTMAPGILPSYSATSRVISSSGSRSHLESNPLAEVSPCRFRSKPRFLSSLSFRSIASSRVLLRLLSTPPLPFCPRIFAIVRPGPLLTEKLYGVRCFELSSTYFVRR